MESRLPAFLENAVSQSERLQLRSHVNGCPACAKKLEAQRHVPAALGSLPRLQPPSDLEIRLRVMASRERAVDRSPRGSFDRWRRNLILNIELMMKPLALPAAGGLCAALLLFMTMAPAFTQHRVSLEDVPLCDLTPSTAPMLRTMAPIGFTDGDSDVDVDLKVDDQGRIVNYSIVGGGLHSDLRRSIENNLLFTTFTPGTAYGVPVPTTVRISFRSSSIDVKG
ncbi:MAG: zf-HC2 domain-containing protein [Acidobacteriaceae bacterium]|nr:zf-HC2 domain-containing protein [Acidobacteriaceae bacterium]